MTLIIGTLIRISSSSWFRIWMGLEINLLSFIPISIKANNLFSSEASLKYFLTQALASNILLFSIIFYLFLIEKFFYYNSHFITLIFSSTIILKRGIAPFHFWFPNVIEGLNWINNFILITWQKVAPLVIISYCLNFYLFLIAIISSSIIGAINGLNQTSLRKIIAYSSINHLRWIIARILNNENIWKIYFIFYSFLSFVIILIFNTFKIFNLNQIFSISIKNKFIKLFISIPLLSLGGLPPFLGFFPKWIVIEILIFSKFYWLIFILINFSLITLYFYIRISYSAFLLNFNKINFFSINILYKKNYKFYLLINFTSLFGLILINLFFLL